MERPRPQSAKAAAEQSVETTLMMQSAMDSLNIDVDMFKYTFSEPDPMAFSEDDLKALNLDDINVLLMLTDREGSQRDAKFTLYLHCDRDLQKVVGFPQSLTCAKGEEHQCVALQHAHRCSVARRLPSHGHQQS